MLYFSDSSAMPLTRLLASNLPATLDESRYTYYLLMVLPLFTQGKEYIILLMLREEFETKTGVRLNLSVMWDRGVFLLLSKNGYRHSIIWERKIFIRTSGWLSLLSDMFVMFSDQWGLWTHQWTLISLTFLFLISVLQSTVNDVWINDWAKVSLVVQKWWSFSTTTLVSNTSDIANSDSS